MRCLQKLGKAPKTWDDFLLGSRETNDKDNDWQAAILSAAVQLHLRAVIDFYLFLSGNKWSVWHEMEGQLLITMRQLLSLKIYLGLLWNICAWKWYYRRLQKFLQIWLPSVCACLHKRGSLMAAVTWLSIQLAWNRRLYRQSASTADNGKYINYISFNWMLCMFDTKGIRKRHGNGLHLCVIIGKQLESSDPSDNFHNTTCHEDKWMSEMQRIQCSSKHQSG